MTVMSKKTISVVIPTYNEEGNIALMCEAVAEIFRKELSAYSFEIVIIDNCSTDKTQEIVLELCQEHKNIKAVFNARNFGPFRSQMYGMYQAKGDAVVLIVADFQEPVELIPAMVREWENDEELKIVCGVRTVGAEGKIKSWLRKMYYSVMDRLSDVEQIKNFTGFGLYDRDVIDAFRQQGDCMPFIRGMVTDFGFKRKLLGYAQGQRKKGKSSFNLYRYYDAAMLGITAYTKVGLRLASFVGLVMMILCLAVAIVHFVMKLMFWDRYAGGTMTILLGICFLGAAQLLFLGMLGEYILSISGRVQNMPLVIERKRVNFEEEIGE